MFYNLGDQSFETDFNAKLEKFQKCIPSFLKCFPYQVLPDPVNLLNRYNNEFFKKFYNESVKG